MLNISSLINVAMMLLGASTLQVLAYDNLSCYHKAQSDGVDPHHCRKALSQIVYDVDVLDRGSGSVMVWYKTCVVNVQKRKSLQPSRTQIESNTQTILTSCPKKGGFWAQNLANSNRTADLVVSVYRSKGSNVYTPEQAICEKKKCAIQANDCLNAFNQIPVDAKGHLMAQDVSRPYYNKVTNGNCTVSISTTDYSTFTATHPEINPLFKQLVNTCGEHPGSIYLNGGASSNNGDVKITIRSPFKDSCVAK